MSSIDVGDCQRTTRLIGRVVLCVLASVTTVALSNGASMVLSGSDDLEADRPDSQPIGN
jgi:hypothetical protein